jgi:tetratricopeptide (TPR) repeat protein
MRRAGDSGIAVMDAGKGINAMLQKTSRRLVGAALFVAACLFLGPAVAADDRDTCRVDPSETAIAACTRVINSGSSTREDLVDAYTNRGQLQFAQKDYDRALADFTIALGLNPHFAIALGNRANCYFDNRDFDRAIADYSQAIGIDANYTAAYAGRAMSYERKGDSLNAIADYRSALAVQQKFQDGRWAHEKARERLQALGAN